MNKVILGTGSYDNVKSGNTVSISGDRGANFGYAGYSCKKLAPMWDTYNHYMEVYSKMKSQILEYDHYMTLKKQIEDQYIKSFYETRLKDLNVDLLLNTLEEKYGRDIVLLCYEPIEEFCHRRLVADYIELQTGMYIPEVAINEKGKVKELVPIRYKKRLEDIM